MINNTKSRRDELLQAFLRDALALAAVAILICIMAIACSEKPTAVAEFQVVDETTTNASPVTPETPVNPITPSEPEPKPEESTTVDKDDEFLKPYVGFVYKTGNRAYFQGANKPRFGYEARVEEYQNNGKTSYRVLFKGVDENGNIVIENSYLYRDKTKDGADGSALYDWRVVYATFNGNQLILKPSNYTFKIYLDKVN